MGHGLQFVGWREPGATWEGWKRGQWRWDKASVSGVFVGASLGFFLSIMTLDLRCWVEVSMLSLPVFYRVFFSLLKRTQWVCLALRGHDDGFLLSLFF